MKKEKSSRKKERIGWILGTAAGIFTHAIRKAALLLKLSEAAFDFFKY